MAKQLQLRRGTTAEHASFTGAVGEVTVDSDKDTIVVHDGYTTGGIPMLRQDVDNLSDNAVPINKLTLGTANQVLTTNAAGTALEWGYANNAGTLTTGTLDTARMAPGTVVQTYRREFNTQYGYGGSPVNLAAYDFTFNNLTVGNKIVVWHYMFYEMQHDISVYVERNGTRLLEGSGGGTQGKWTPVYDNNEDSTPSGNTMIFIDDVVSTSQTYRFYKEGNGATFYINRCYNSSNETGTTCTIAQEIKA